MKISSIMKIHVGLLAVWMCIFLYTLPAASQNGEGNYLFTHLTMDDGLPSNYVEDLMKDRQGFLWVSTGGNGVTRFDGYRFETFNAFSGETRLKSNFIQKFCEDRFGRIWLAGEQGIDILDAHRIKSLFPKTVGRVPLSGFVTSICITAVWDSVSTRAIFGLTI